MDIFVCKEKSKADPRTFNQKIQCDNQDRDTCQFCSYRTCLANSLDMTTTSKNFCLDLRVGNTDRSIPDYCKHMSCPSGNLGETTCVRCQNRFYFDHDTGRCTFARYSIPNCLYHEGPHVCARCKPGFYLYSNKSSCEMIEPNTHADIKHCIQAQAVISGSNIDFLCLACDTGYKVSSDSRSCLLIEQGDLDLNCLT